MLISASVALHLKHYKLYNFIYRKYTLFNHSRKKKFSDFLKTKQKYVSRVCELRVKNDFF